MSGLQAENYIDPEFALGSMARELEPGERAADAVDYEDMGADDSMALKKPPSNNVEDTGTDIDFELGYDNHWERHPYMEPEKEALEAEFVKLSRFLLLKLGPLFTFSPVVDPESGTRHGAATMSQH